MKKLVIALAAMLLSVPATAQTFADLTVDPANPPPALSNPHGPHAWIDDGLTISTYIQTIPTHTDGENGPDDVGAFRFICGPGQVLADDPVVYPGQPGRSHVHLFYGNLGTNASSTYDSQRTTGLSTCGNVLNRTGYWTPGFIIPDGRVLRPNRVSIYYKGYPVGNPPCQATPGNLVYKGRCVNIPHAIRFIFGYDMITNTTTGFFFWKCFNIVTGVSAADYTNITDAMHSCKSEIGANAGNVTNYEVGLTIEAPPCWDGVNLDSANHRSHLHDFIVDSNSSRAACPKTHPYVIPFFRLNIAYGMDSLLYAEMDKTSADWNTGNAASFAHFSSDLMPGMTPHLPGSTAHADYVEGWNETIKDTWYANCINRWLNCTGGDLGNGTGLIESSEAFRPASGAVPRYVKRPKLTKEAVDIHLHKM